jgi:hypothetical protein
VAVAPAAPSRTPAELRRFGFTVGGVFLALAGLSAWRGHTAAPLVMAGLGAALVLPALVVPRVLRPVEHGWMAFAAVLGAINTRIILTLVYVVIVTPIGWLRRLGGDPLNRRLGSDAASHWIKRAHETADVERYRKQF